ncbi:MAG: OmpA family protein, partial [Pseudonocardiaceae bacterium]
RADDHCIATVWKVPDGSTSGPSGAIDWGVGPTGYAGTFTSAMLGKTGDMLNYRLEFVEGSSDVFSSVCTSFNTALAGDLLLDMLVVEYQPATKDGGAPITVTGHASTAGASEDNLELSRRRAEAVRDYLRMPLAPGAKGIEDNRIKVVAEGELNATLAAEWQRVDIQVGGGHSQIVMAHETGHMFGLGDEYVDTPGGLPTSGTGGQIGGVPSHGLPPVAGGGIAPARVEDNDGVMSLGNVVRAQHYATFLEALNEVTKPETFKYGGDGPAPFLRIPRGPSDPVPLP